MKGCKKCGLIMNKRTGKFGKFLYCSCGYTKSIKRQAPYFSDSHSIGPIEKFSDLMDAN